MPDAWTSDYRIDYTSNRDWQCVLAMIFADTPSAVASFVQQM